MQGLGRLKMGKKKLLYLNNGKADALFYDCKLPDNLRVCNLYKNGNFFQKAVQRLVVKWHIPFYRFVFGDWYRQQVSYDVVVIEALRGKKNVVPILKRRFPESRIILWHWNKMFENSIRPEDSVCSGCELWSFDPEDCKKYNMKFNSQWYNINIRDKILPKRRAGDVSCATDVFFVGAAKSRIGKLSYVKKVLEEAGLTTDFYVVGRETGDCAAGISVKHVSLPYEEILNRIEASSAILDITTEGQSGLSLRPLEALVFQKKLITDNSSIKNYKFYNKDNIFIIGGQTKPNELYDFVKAPFIPVDEEVVRFFGLERWLERFLDDSEVKFHA